MLSKVGVNRVAGERSCQWLGLSYGAGPKLTGLTVRVSVLREVKVAGILRALERSWMAADVCWSCVWLAVSAVLVAWVVLRGWPQVDRSCSAGLVFTRS